MLKETERERGGVEVESFFSLGEREGDAVAFFFLEARASRLFVSSWYLFQSNNKLGVSNSASDPLQVNLDDSKEGSESCLAGRKNKKNDAKRRRASAAPAAIIATTNSKTARTSPPLLQQPPSQVQGAAPQREQERRRRPFGEETERLERNCH